MVSKIFYFHPYLGKWFSLTNIFQLGWNHQLDDVAHLGTFVCCPFLPWVSGPSANPGGLVLCYRSGQDKAVNLTNGQMVAFNVRLNRSKLGAKSDKSDKISPEEGWEYTPQKIQQFAPQNGGFQVRNLLFPGGPHFQGRFLSFREGRVYRVDNWSILKNGDWIKQIEIIMILHLFQNGTIEMKAYLLSNYHKLPQDSKIPFVLMICLTTQVKHENVFFAFKKGAFGRQALDVVLNRHSPLS